MAKKICYGELCRVDQKIHLQNWLIIGLSAAVIIAAALIGYSVITGTDFLSIPIFPSQL